MKRVLMILLVLMLIVSSAFAEQLGREVNGDLSPDEGYVSPYGEEQYRRDKMEPENRTIEDLHRNGYSVSLNVPTYWQQTNYYCGPASVEMVIDYIRGPVNNQNYYANFMGTTTDGTSIWEIHRALNAHQSRYTYDKRVVGNMNDLIWRTKFSLDRNVPYIADINTVSAYNQGNWYYGTTGHYIVVSGMYTNSSGGYTMNIRDPWLVGATTKSASVMLQVITSHWDSSIVH